MPIGLSKAGNVDQPIRQKIKTRKTGNQCICPSEEPVEEAIEVIAAKTDKDWQKEEPPYYHREIF